MLKILIPEVFGEETIMPSVTEPDQVLSLNEILMRYSLNGTLPLGKGVYDDDDPQVGEEEFVDDPTRDLAFDFLDAHIYEREYELRQQTEAASASIERDHQADETEVSQQREVNSASSPNDESDDKKAASE